MSPSRVSISARSARLIVGFMDDHLDTLHPYEARALAELSAAFRPRPSKRLSRERKETKRKTRKDETAEIRAAVFARSAGCCESCSRVFNLLDPGEMDHFFGRAREKQSERNCWALCRLCHRSKTGSRPTVGHWLTEFVLHAAAHGYLAEGNIARNRLDSIALMSQAVTT